MSDNGRDNGHVTKPPRAEAETGGVHVVGDGFEFTAAVLRLLVGGLLVGADELRGRLQQWEPTTDSGRSADLQTRYESSSEYVPVSTSVRRAFVGLLFEVEARTRENFSTMVERFTAFSDRAEYLFATRLEPRIRRTPLEPALGRLDEVLFTAMTTVDRWSARGRLEERRGRALARRALANVADEVFDYMSRNPEVRELIERQGTTMAGEAIDEVRGRTASADKRIEQIAHNLLRRPAREVAAEKTTSVEASPVGDGGG